MVRIPIDESEDTDWLVNRVRRVVGPLLPTNEFWFRRRCSQSQANEASDQSAEQHDAEGVNGVNWWRQLNWRGAGDRKGEQNILTSSNSPPLRPKCDHCGAEVLR